MKISGKRTVLFQERPVLRTDLEAYLESNRTSWM